MIALSTKVSLSSYPIEFSSSLSIRFDSIFIIMILLIPQKAILKSFLHSLVTTVYFVFFLIDILLTVLHHFISRLSLGFFFLSSSLQHDDVLRCVVYVRSLFVGFFLAFFSLLTLIVKNLASLSQKTKAII